MLEAASQTTDKYETSIQIVDKGLSCDSFIFDHL